MTYNVFGGTLNPAQSNPMTVVVYCENSVQHVPPDGFFGIQIVQNSFSNRLSPIQLEGAYDAPQNPSRLGVEYRLPISYSLDAFGTDVPATFERWLWLRPWHARMRAYYLVFSIQYRYGAVPIQCCMLSCAVCWSLPLQNAIYR